MTSADRKKIRYENRQRKRNAKKSALNEQYDFKQMESQNLWIQAAKKSRTNVNFKPSVQKYMEHPLTNIDKSIEQIKDGKYPFPVNIRRIVVVERGKARFIEPIVFPKRVGEHVFCDNILTPFFKNKLIYDNGASIKNKGTDFTRRRVRIGFEEAIALWGYDFYIWQFDFKSFFESVKYRTVHNILYKNFTDESIINFSMTSVEEHTQGNILILKNSGKIAEAEELENKYNAGDGNGICLGSQNSQNIALIVPNELDHFIKDKFGMKFYRRCMDDGIVLYKDKETLIQLSNECEKICKKLGLNFNPKKTKIVKATKGVTFLKEKYNVLPDECKLLRRSERSGIIRLRRKLKRFKNLVMAGKMNMDDVFNSFQASYENIRKKGKTFHTRKSLIREYRLLFGDYKLDKLRI